jgi:RNA polymerase sigma factor (sigma-70 family)
MTMSASAEAGKGAVSAGNNVRAEPTATLTDLYMQEWKQLVRLAALLLGDVSAAEDTVQEAFVRLSVKDVGGWDRAIRLAYLRTTVVNLSRSALRRRVVAARHLSRPQNQQAGADVGALQAFERSTLIAALRRLPRRQREMLALRYYDDLSYTEIAAVMRVKVGTVSSTLFKATAACAALMEDQR